MGNLKNKGGLRNVTSDRIKHEIKVPFDKRSVPLNMIIQTRSRRFRDLSMQSCNVIGLVLLEGLCQKKLYTGC